MLCLLVEDDEVSLVLCKHIVEACGFEVRTASNGLEALDACKKDMPPLILLDRMMPKMDGIAFLHELKKYCSHSKLELPRVIMTSAKAEASNVRTALDAGAFSYLSKPYSEEDLNIKIGLAMKIKLSAENRVRLSDNGA